MNPLLYPLIGIAAMGGFIGALYLCYLLRYVLVFAGVGGLITVLGAMTVVLITGNSDPVWLGPVAIGSCLTIIIGILFCELD